MRISDIYHVDAASLYDQRLRVCSACQHFTPHGKTFCSRLTCGCEAHNFLRRPWTACPDGKWGAAVSLDELIQQLRAASARPAPWVKEVAENQLRDG